MSVARILLTGDTHMNRTARLTLLFVVLVIALAATACRKRNRDVETPEGTVRSVPEARSQETGWPLYEVRNEGFALSLPPNWRQFDMNPATFDKHLQESLRVNPELQPMLSNLRAQIAAGVKFFGFDESSAKTGFATNVNVLRLALPPGANLDALAAESMTQLQRLPTVRQPVGRERIRTATGECERFRYQMSLQVRPGETRVLAITQFLFVTPTDGYSVTLTTVADREAHYAQTFDTIGRSFRLLK